MDVGEHLGKQKIIREPDTEWQQSVKKKKGEDYYSKLKEVLLFLGISINLDVTMEMYQIKMKELKTSL